MSFKGIIFDLDGVICSTDKYHYLAWKKALEILGINLTEDINNRLRGVSRMESLNIILNSYGAVISEEEKVIICENKNIIYREMLKKMTSDELDKDVLDTLLQLKKNGIKIAIGSSSKNTKYILAKLEIIYLFDAIADGNDIVKSKPDPEVFLKASLKLNENPSDCAVVEDAVSGVEAAKNGGFYAVAISDAKKCILADKRIEKLSDILSLVDEI